MWALPRGRNRVFKGNQSNCAPKMVLSGSHNLPMQHPELHDTTGIRVRVDRLFEH